MSELDEALRANRRALLELSAPDLGSIASVMDDVASELSAALKKMRTSGAASQHELHRHGRTLVQLSGAIDTAREKLPQAVRATLRTKTREAGVKAMQNLRRLAEAGSRRFGGVAGALRLPQASILLDLQRSVVVRHASSATRYAGDVGANIRRQMAHGLIRGEGVEGIAQRLVGIKTASVDQIAGRVAEMSLSSATRLVRTELNGAYAQTEMAGIRALNDAESTRPGDEGGGPTAPPPWLKMWDATLDMRTCHECRRMHGEIRPVNALFSCGLMGPPIHPNDRCGVIPWMQSWPRNALRGP